MNSSEPLDSAVCSALASVMKDSADNQLGRLGNLLGDHAEVEREGNEIRVIVPGPSGVRALLITVNPSPA